ncbi:MAG: ferritin-like domain-containing protein [Ignavibacteriaceae bacterium]
MTVKTLKDLVIDGIEDMYNAEMQLTKALPKLAEKASNSSLKEAFQEHLKETKNHVKRLENVFKELEMNPKEKICMGIKGIVSEGEEFINEVKESDVMDAALVAAGQKAEHYEISSYGTLINLSKRLGLDNVAKYLKDNLVEEYTADDKLTKISDSEVNRKAEAVH